MCVCCQSLYKFIRCLTLTGKGLMITSLCPILGKQYSITRPHMCPTYLQHPRGKELPISIMGLSPYVIKNDKKDIIDGAELQIIAIYAKKFDFKPNLIPAPTFDGDGGMVDTVIKICLLQINI